VPKKFSAVLFSAFIDLLKDDGAGQPPSITLPHIS
jgi:hypothetical protein